MAKSPKAGSKITFASGAQRSEKKPRYDLIPTTALRRLAARYQLGAEHYGEDNWYKGLPLDDTINHIIDHLLRYRDRVKTMKGQYTGVELQMELKAMAGKPDDDLAGATWGCVALMWLEENGKLL